MYAILRVTRRLVPIVGCLMLLVVGLAPKFALGADDAPYSRPVQTIGEALASGRVSQETYDAVRTRGAAAIIARLRLPIPFRAEGSIPSLVDQQRQSIAAVQQRVLQQLSGRRVDNVKRFQTIPHIALEVDTAALTALVAMPEIEIILADTPLPPALGTSVPAVGADNVQNAYGLANAGAGQAVAIVDSGVDTLHPFLGGRVVSQACYSTESSVSDSVCPGGVEETIDPNSGGPCSGLALCTHGTLVAGIAAGNGAGVTGAPPPASHQARRSSRFRSSASSPTTPRARPLPEQTRRVCWPIRLTPSRGWSACTSAATATLLPRPT